MEYNGQKSVINILCPMDLCYSEPSSKKLFYLLFIFSHLITNKVVYSLKRVGEVPGYFFWIMWVHLFVYIN